MRDIVLTLFVFGSLPFILRTPYLGVLMWSFLSYANPHRFTWGFAYSMPFAQIVAITLLVAMVFNRQKIEVPRNGIIVLWILFIAWMGLTTLFAIFPESAMQQLIKVIKIQLVTFLSLLLIDDRKKLNELIWVIVISIGFFSTKGGVFTLLTGGAYRVWGPAGSFITENNTLAVATLMIMPLMVYLRQLHKDNTWIKHGLSLVFIFSAVSVFGSQSRGAFLAVMAVGGFFWLKSKTKVFTGLGILLLGALILSFMPESWYERMNTIQNYEEDKSAMGRLNSWQYTINVASDRITGAGFESWSSETFSIWAPDPEAVHAAHSIFFGVLGDHGWPGLVLFGLILLCTWISLGRSIRKTSGRSDLLEENLLGRMLQVCLIAYASGGAFLSLAYFDLPWHLIAIAILLSRNINLTLNKSALNDVDENKVVIRPVSAVSSRSFAAKNAGN